MALKFNNADYARMETVAKEKLGWTFQEKCGISLKEMVENLEIGRQALLKARKKSGFVDKIKISKILSFLKDPNWKQIIRDRLS